jgi:hypothetical protein
MKSSISDAKNVFIISGIYCTIKDYYKCANKKTDQPLISSAKVFKLQFNLNKIIWIRLQVYY